MEERSDTEVAAAMAEILSLLANRRDGATICPSEAARSLSAGDDDWRIFMPPVHCAVDALLARGEIELSWKGKPMETRSGPYRIGKPRP